MNESACECSFHVEVVSVGTRGSNRPSFGPSRRVRWIVVVGVSGMGWAPGVIRDSAGLWGIMQSAQAEIRAGGEPVAEVGQVARTRL